MSWTEADGDALFRQPPGDKADDEKQGAFDGGPEAMRRLRNPFETDGQADAANNTPKNTPTDTGETAQR